MILQGAQSQQRDLFLYPADATMTGSAQLVLGRSMSRSSLIVQNLSANPMYLEIGSGRATATLTSGVVTSVTVTNAGFNFTKPPLVRFLGGGPAGQNGPYQNTSYVGLSQSNGPAPSKVARAHAVLSGGAISSIVVDDGGAGYVLAPFVQLIASNLDPNGASIPSSTSGITLPANMTTPIAWNGTTCPTEAVSVLGTSGGVLFCRWTE